MYLATEKEEASFRCLLPFYPNVVFVFLPLPSGVALLSSSQALYRLFPCKHKNALTPLLLLSPKSLLTFRGPRRLSQSHIPIRRSFNFRQLSLSQTQFANLLYRRVDIKAILLYNVLCSYVNCLNSLHIRFSKTKVRK